MSAVTGTAITHKTTTLNQSARALEAADQDEAAEQNIIARRRCWCGLGLGTIVR